MTYSEVVHVLSGHMIPKNEEGQMMPLLEKFVNQEMEGNHLGIHMGDNSQEMDELDRGDH